MIARYHVRVIFVAEQFDTESPGGRMMPYVLGAVAELYVRITSQRVREMNIGAGCGARARLIPDQCLGVDNAKYLRHASTASHIQHDPAANVEDDGHFSG